MGAFGEKLRREREMRGISLNEISESTKISRRHLEALESEEFDSLPGGVFNRGFVRAYARFVGIDEDQAVADYTSVRQEELPTPDLFPVEVQSKPDRKVGSRHSSWSLLLAGAALAGFIAIMLMRSRNRSGDSATAAVPPVTASTPSQAQSPPQPSPAASVTPAALTVTNGVPNGEPTPATLATPLTSDPSTSPTPVTSATPGTPTPTPVSSPTPAVLAALTPTASRPPVNPTPLHKPPTTLERVFVIVVRAKEDAWVSLRADNQTAFEGVLRANSRRVVKAAKLVVLTTGNAGGLVVSHNGKRLGALGSESEVRTVSFNRLGLVQLR